VSAFKVKIVLLNVILATNMRGKARFDPFPENVTCIHLCVWTLE